jgi:hypothetical protein
VNFKDKTQSFILEVISLEPVEEGPPSCFESCFKLMTTFEKPDVNKNVSLYTSHGGSEVCQSSPEHQ